MEKNLRNTSRFLSLVLRHQPELIGLLPDAHGWVSVQDLLLKVNAYGIRLTEDLLHEIVAQNEKQRFRFNEDHSMIRANQGHSITIDLNLPPAIPPEQLFHGTAASSVEAILQEGLQKRQRTHVHLTGNQHTARQVGSRHGVPVLLLVEAGRMHQDGHVFFLSDNGVWLTEAVPPQYLSRI